jgi:hypothetical protein
VPGSKRAGVWFFTREAIEKYKTNATGDGGVREMTEAINHDDNDERRLNDTVERIEQLAEMQEPKALILSEEDFGGMILFEL